LHLGSSNLRGRGEGTFPVALALYNFISLSHTEQINMPLVGENQLAERRLLTWRGILILVTAFAITLSLAGRFFEAPIFHTPTAHSGVAHAKVQHRDSDSAQLGAPTATFTIRWGSESSAGAEILDPLYERVHCESLHNRPPPVS
jgi:hypothetical protein